MKIKIRRNMLYFFWILKIIFDMFYQIKLFSIFTTLISILLLFHAMVKKNLKINKIDIPVIILMLLFTISFCKSPAYYIDYFKIISSFILYFLGRYYYDEFEITNEALKKALFVALIVNLVACMIGKGTIVWGNALTYRGVYYFKTDFAMTLLFFLVIWLYNSKIDLKSLIFCLIALILIVLCNARIVYLCTIIALFILYLYKKKYKKRLISLKNFTLILCLGIFCIYFLRFLSQTNLFITNKLISLNFNSLSELFNGSNTQGRNEIWTLLLNSFNKQSIVTKIFGTGMNFNYLYGYTGLNEHSTYIKILLNTGYFGLTMFLTFVISAILNIRKEKNMKISYMTFTMLVIYLIVGFSIPTILYTNCSWIPMFFLGCCITNVSNREKMEENRDE